MRNASVVIARDWFENIFHDLDKVPVLEDAGSSLMVESRYGNVKVSKYFFGEDMLTAASAPFAHISDVKSDFESYYDHEYAKAFQETFARLDGRKAGDFQVVGRVLHCHLLIEKRIETYIESFIPIVNWRRLFLRRTRVSIIN